MSEYTERADRFLVDTGTKLSIEYLRTAPYFIGETKSRDVYRFTLSNARGSYSHEFGNSIQATENREAAHTARIRAPLPSAYDILAGIGGHVEPIFEDWVRDEGYDAAPMTDYPKVRGLHDDCLRESQALARMFTPEQSEQLSEIN